MQASGINVTNALDDPSSGHAWLYCTCKIDVWLRDLSVRPLLCPSAKRRNNEFSGRSSLPRGVGTRSHPDTLGSGVCFVVCLSWLSLSHFHAASPEVLDSDGWQRLSHRRSHGGVCTYNAMVSHHPIIQTQSVSTMAACWVKLPSVARWINVSAAREGGEVPSTKRQEREVASAPRVEFDMTSYVRCSRRRQRHTHDTRARAPRARHARWG